jgi:hypothetical protein
MQVQGSARTMAGYLDYLSRAPTSLIFASIAPSKIAQIANPDGLVGGLSLPFKGTRQSLACASRPNDLVRDSVMAQEAT